MHAPSARPQHPHCPDLFPTPSLWRWPVAPRSALPTRPGCVRFERREMQGFNSLCAARGGGRATECNVTSAFRRGIA